jgi:hypothetical protein
MLDMSRNGRNIEGHFGNQNGVGAACHPCEGANPTGMSPHDFEHLNAIVRLSCRMQPVNRFGCNVHCRCESDRRFGTADIVIDGLGNADAQGCRQRDAIGWRQRACPLPL